MRFAAAALAALVLFAAPGLARSAPRGERFLVKPPKGWVLAANATRAGIQSLLYTPPGQTPSAWTQMLTVQIISGLTLSPDAALANVRNSYDAACGGVKAGPVQTGVSNGYASAFWVLGCAANSQAGGRGEAAFFHLIQGDEALYLAQRAWRLDPFSVEEGPPLSQAQQNEGVETLRSFIVCNPDKSPPAPCPAP